MFQPLQVRNYVNDFFLFRRGKLLFIVQTMVISFIPIGILMALNWDQLNKNVSNTNFILKKESQVDSPC